MIRSGGVVILCAYAEATIWAEEAPIAVTDRNVVSVPVPIIRPHAVSTNSRPNMCKKRFSARKQTRTTVNIVNPNNPIAMRT